MSTMSNEARDVVDKKKDIEPRDWEKLNYRAPTSAGYTGPARNIFQQAIIERHPDMMDAVRAARPSEFNLVDGKGRTILDILEAENRTTSAEYAYIKANGGLTGKQLKQNFNQMKHIMEQRGNQGHSHRSRAPKKDTAWYESDEE